MSGALSRFSKFFTKHPILRGVASYSIIWPTSCIIQQTFDGKRWDTYDWMKCARFCIYGSCFVAPTVYCWIRVASELFPGNGIKVAIIKAAVEQVTYTPFAMISFFFGMSLLEGKQISECIDEVKAKLGPTYKVGVCIWPAVATINFALIPEKNRVPFISVCSLLWTSFLAYMKQLNNEDEAKNETVKPNLKTPAMVM